MALLAAGCGGRPACYQAVSEGQGWKRVPLPAAAPHLAAAAGVDQLRPGEPMTVWSDWSRANGWLTRLGTSRYSLPMYYLDEVVEVAFGSRLGGAAVEVVGWRGAKGYTLVDRRRMHEDTLRLVLEPGTDSVEVTVHHHLRARPEVRWRAGWQAQAPGAAGWLHYFDPGEGAMELCEAPASPMGVRFWRLPESDAEPPPARLRATALTRLLHRGG